MRYAIQQDSLRYIESISRRLIVGEPPSGVMFSFTRAMGEAQPTKKNRAECGRAFPLCVSFPHARQVVHVDVFTVFVGLRSWVWVGLDDGWMGGWMSFRADHRPGQGSPIFSSVTLSFSPESLLRFRVLAKRFAVA